MDLPDQVTEEKFRNLAMNYALENSHLPEYRHMITEQKSDFNIYCNAKVFIRIGT